MDVTDAQWAVLPTIIPVPPRRPDGRGRPWRDARAVRNGMLWIVRTGAPWKALPERYPPSQTCHRRFQPWVRAGVCAPVLQALASDVQERGGLALAECVIDGIFIVAKQGGRAWARPRGAQGRSAWPWQTALVCLSPSALTVRRRMQSPLRSQLSPRALLMGDRHG